MNRTKNIKDSIIKLDNFLSSDIFEPTDTIQVLRDNTELLPGYRPVIDWYYSDEEMEAGFPEDYEKIDHRLIQLKKEYEEVKPYLETLSVKMCLSEIKGLRKHI